MVAKGKDSGLEMTREDAIAYTLRQGKIMRAEYYNDQQQAREALGLPERADDSAEQEP
jgi:ketosteroid isomerase-like protein